MKRKILSVLLTSFMAVTLLSGCAGGGGAQQSETEHPEAVSTDETGGRVELKVWAEEATFDALSQMVDSFKEEYKGQAEFDITLEQNVDSFTKENVLADVHNAADVFIMVDDQVASLAAAGALHPVPNAEEVKAANVGKAVDSATINDVLYAYPMTADNGYFLYYNKQYFTDSDVTTLDQVLQVAADHKKKAAMDWSSGWYLYSFFGKTGLDFGINEDGVTNHCDWNSKEGDIKGTDGWRFHRRGPGGNRHCRRERRMGFRGTEKSLGQRSGSCEASYLYRSRPAGADGIFFRLQAHRGKCLFQESPVGC